METPNSIYRQIRQLLAEAGVPDSATDAGLLFHHVAGRRHWESAALTGEQAAQLLALAHRRANREPLQYLLGHWPFGPLCLAVGPGVLIPRPETELVAQAAAEELACAPRAVALDLCSGTGAIALYLQHGCPEADITAVELETAAFDYLMRNCETYAQKSSGAPRPVQADALQYAEQLAPASVGLVVANPPYVTKAEYATLEPELYFEPRTALVADEDGLVFYRKIAQSYAAALDGGGCLVFEIGAAQGIPVRTILETYGYKSTEIRPDYAGLDRIAVARRP